MPVMADLLFLAVMVALFGVSVLFIRVCDRIIGADEDIVVGTFGEDAEETLAA